ncbi:MerR family transcriptional regulator [Clostridium bovifaecis]|uniref:MerR family transcriptional regulator n=1 Tax=Clostridium bovifaecis TaxID=2184719 RepID=A0A6I6F786_9CLOT|nr:MerR family transcriptional regulator [Clostridium bovifaecis]
MYKISEFSKITTLTIKALRYYDEQGILQPSCRTKNNYRMYDNNDFEKAKMIVLLRKLKFSIAEIKDVLNNCSDKVELQCYLLEKKSMIAKEIEKEKTLIKEINRYISPNKNVEVNSMNYEFQVRNIAAIKVISVRFKGSYCDIGKYIKLLYKSAKNHAAGAPMNLYYDDEYKENADIELCIPVSGLISRGDIVVKKLPQINALCTTHIGSYETINLAYKSIIDYANEKGLIMNLPSREVYRKGPGMIFKGNPEKYVTEIIIPIKQGE